MHMTPAQVDQVDRDIFGEAFSGIPQRPRDPFRRIARDPIQQEETLPQGITSVPAQPPNEPIRPNFNRLQPSSSSSSLQPTYPPLPPPPGAPGDDDAIVEEMWDALLNPQEEGLVPFEPQPPQTVPSEPILVPHGPHPLGTDASWDYNKF